MSFTRLRYHITTATKGRRRFITPEVESVLFEAICQRVRELGAYVIELNGTEDHIHIIVAIPPTVSLSNFMRDVKAYSAKEVRKVFARLGFKWQVGYGAFTLNPFDMGRVVEYVRNQKEHHANNTVIEIFERIDSIQKGSR